MSGHFIVAVDHGQLRIYTEGNTLAPFPPRVQLIDSIDLDDADTAALASPRRARTRVPVSRNGSARNGAGTVHGNGRREELRRQAQVIAQKLQAFWQEHPLISWDLAASPALYNAIIEALSPNVGRRLKRVYSKTAIGEGSEVGATTATA